MHVLFLLTQSLDSPGGSGRFFPLAKALVGEGYRVTLVALHHDYAHAERRRFVQDGVEVRYVGQMHVLKRGNRKTYYAPGKLAWVALLATLRLTWAALTTRCDAIHVCKSQPMNGIAGRIGGIVRRVPVFVDSDDYEAANNRFGSSRQQRVVAWFEDWYATFVAGITVNTTFVARRYAGLGYPTERIVLVPNGVDRDRFALAADAPALDALRQTWNVSAADDVLVYVGSMSLTSHAVDLLLHAVAQVLPDVPRLRLFLVGGGEDLDALKELARELELGESVVFVGRVSADKVPLWYRMGRVSVDPRRASLPVESSMPLKVVESIAAGTPVISADIGDFPNAVGEAGVVVEPGNAQALADAICRLMRSPDLLQSMRDAALDAREQAYWDVRVKAFMRVYAFAD